MLVQIKGVRIDLDFCELFLIFWCTRFFSIFSREFGFVWDAFWALALARQHYVETLGYDFIKELNREAEERKFCEVTRKMMLMEVVAVYCREHSIKYSLDPRLSKEDQESVLLDPLKGICAILERDKGAKRRNMSRFAITEINQKIWEKLNN